MGEASRASECGVCVMCGCGSRFGAVSYNRTHQGRSLKREGSGRMGGPAEWGVRQNGGSNHLLGSNLYCK